MGYAGKVLSVSDASVTFVLDLMALDSKLAVYEHYREFLREISVSSDIPWELSMAAYCVLQEMEEGAYGKVKDFATALIQETDAAEMITEETFSILLGEAGAASFTGWLKAVDITAWFINQTVDIGAMVKEVACVMGYAKLQMHYTKKLEASKQAFLGAQTADNAWDFFENYSLLYQLRDHGEEAMIELYKVDGILKYFDSFIISWELNIKQIRSMKSSHIWKNVSLQ